MRDVIESDKFNFELLTDKLLKFNVELLFISLCLFYINNDKLFMGWWKWGRDRGQWR